MSWSMPTTGQWNSNVAPMPQMNPDMSNMGNYTQEQWAAMQQQNWQQWAQWQQQYAQWQNQYGDKYSQEMQAMQGMPAGSMGGMGVAAPVMPMSTIVPPVPPPPDNPPPPPPPHENDQPLYGQPQSSVTTPAPVSNHTMYQNTNTGGNNNVNQSWQYSQQNMDNSYAQPVSASNTEALQKLAEEERLFDIQFKKWEEEIEKWKRENVNHPDKQAYKEYQDKFEACRAQLLERRKQMNQKRAKLLGNTAPTNNLTNSSNINQGKSLNANKYNNNSVNQSQNSRNSHYQPYSDTMENDYSKPGNQAKYSNSNNKVIEIQDISYDSYGVHEPGDQHQDNSKPYFLASSKSNEGIPGLDLVPADRNSQNKNQNDVIDIIEDTTKVNSSKAPDYSTISKGINNILGDEKIMHILSMVAQNNQEPSDQRSNEKTNYNQWNNQRDSNDMYNNDQYDNRYMNRQRPMNNQFQQQGQGPMSLNFNQNSSHDQGPGTQGPPSLLSIPTCPPQNFGQQGSGSQSYGQNFGPQRSDHFQNKGAGSQGRGPYGSGPTGPGGNQMQNQPPNNLNYRNEDYPPPRMQGFSQQQHNVPPPMQGRGPPPAQGTGQPLMQGRGPPPTMDYNSIEGGMQGNAQNPQLGDQNPQLMNNMTMRPNMSQDPSQSYSNEPPKSKWGDEPLFTPSIIVEYEHKSLRLKARDFLEPVHTFDYNHTSKDQDEKITCYRTEDNHTSIMRKNTRREYVELTVERPSRDFNRHPPPQDFERRPLRAPPVEDWSHGHDRNIPARQRSESRFDDRRYDERNRRDEYLDDRDLGRRRPPLNRREDARREDNKRDDKRRDDNRRDDSRKDDGRRDDSRREDSRRDDSRRDDSRRDDSRRDDSRRDDSRRDDSRRDDSRRDDSRRDDSRRDDNRRDDNRRDDNRNQNSIRDDDSRKRSNVDNNKDSSEPKKSKDEIESRGGNDMRIQSLMIDDLLEMPGREMRPEKIVIILRGPPGSGKSYLAKLIRDKEAEYGGTARIMSIDDYFMQETEVEDKDPNTGKIGKKIEIKYEYDQHMEETYLNSLKRAFKRTLSENFFPFLIYDAINESLQSYGDIWNLSTQSGFQVYICTMEMDAETCFKRNIHNRSLDDIQVIITRFCETPAHHTALDATTLLQNAAITEVQMEDVEDDVIMEDAQDPEVEQSFTSKWDKMEDAAQLARLDGTSKPLRPSQLSMEDYLQLDDWTPSKVTPGKKTVRWADIEERREQEKMRAIGFVVGKTDWHRMTDPTMGSSALTQTKYIERVRRNQH